MFSVKFGVYLLGDTTNKEILNFNSWQHFRLETENKILSDTGFARYVSIPEQLAFWLIPKSNGKFFKETKNLTLKLSLVVPPQN